MRTEALLPQTPASV